MSVKDKLAELKKNLPKAEPLVKIIEKVVSHPVDFQKEFFKTLAEDSEALPDFENYFSALSSGKKKNVIAHLEYYFLLAQGLKGGTGSGRRSKGDYSELIGVVERSSKEGYKQTEVAQLLGISASAVNTYIKTGKLSLTAKLISKYDLIEFLKRK